MRRYSFSWCLACIAMLFLGSPVWGQKKKPTIIGGNPDWSEGTVLLNDGTELAGLLRYDDNSNVLNFKDDSDSQVFTPRTLVGFEFTDGATGKQRIFYTFSATETNSDVVEPLFFEFLREYKDFTVLSRLDPLEVDKRSRGDVGSAYNPATHVVTNVAMRVVVSQSETIYFRDHYGVIKPYLRIMEKDVTDGTSGKAKVKNKILDHDLLSKLTVPLYSELMSCAEQNDFRLDRKEGLLAALDCYSKFLK